MESFTQQSAEDFIGTWELVSIEARTGTGDWADAPLPITGRPVGMLIYDEKGNMAVQITGNPRSVETPSDNSEIVNGYVAYYGQYEVDLEAGTVTHYRRTHLNPDLANLRAVRYFQFSEDVLTLTVAPERQLRLNWIRVS